MDSVKDLMKAVGESDAVVIVTNHKTYDYKAILASARFVFDTRNALGELARDNPKVERL
jgi:UDP-N-acetyl-D-glucosamine dehydrogenase